MASSVRVYERKDTHFSEQSTKYFALPWVPFNSSCFCNHSRQLITMFESNFAASTAVPVMKAEVRGQVLFLFCWLWYFIRLSFERLPVWPKCSPLNNKVISYTSFFHSSGTEKITFTPAHGGYVKWMEYEK